MPSKVTVRMVLYVCAWVAFTEGGQICLKEEGEDSFLCADTYYTVGFCCGRDHDGYFEKCCYYTKIWALWYFWLGIVLFLFLVGGCITGVTRFLRKSDDDTSSKASSEAEQVVFVAQQQPVPTQVVQITDAPPSYQQAQAQESQSKEYAKYGTPIDKPVSPS